MRVSSVAVNLLERAVKHPQWIAEDIRGRWRRRGGWDFSLAEHAGLVADARTVLCETIGASTADYDAALDAGWWPQIPDDHQAGRAQMSAILRAATRLSTPAVVVETGVARGVTTAVTLQAMQDNGRGHLYSVDLPPLRAAEGYVGNLVPNRLRHRWTLRPGPSRQVLPRLLSDLDEIDIFFHDAEHSYNSQMEEFEAAWPHLRAGGLLIADDVRNPAIIEFARRVGVRAHIIGKVTDADGVGVLRKPN